MTTSDMKIGKFGKDSRRWKGEDASYTAKHMWILKHYGKAKKCSKDPNHKAKRYEWANISGLYRRDFSDYKELCPSCHRILDVRNIKKECNHGHLFTEETTYIDPRGYRGCKVCRKLSVDRYKEGKKNAVN